MRRRWDDEEWTGHLCHDDVLKQVVVKMKTTLNQSCVSSAPPPPDDLPAVLLCCPQLESETPTGPGTPGGVSSQVVSPKAPPHAVTSHADG